MNGDTKFPRICIAPLLITRFLIFTLEQSKYFLLFEDSESRETNSITIVAFLLVAQRKKSYLRPPNSFLIAVPSRIFFHILKNRRFIKRTYKIRTSKRNQFLLFGLNFNSVLFTTCITFIANFGISKLLSSKYIFMYFHIFGCDFNIFPYVLLFFSHIMFLLFPTAQAISIISAYWHMEFGLILPLMFFAIY